MTTGRCRRYWTLGIVITATALGSRPASAETFEVTLEGISFWYNGTRNMDHQLDIQIGDTVRWLWVEGFHNVVSGFPDDENTGDFFTSGPPTSVTGTTFEYTFDESGVYGYHCHPHESAGMFSFVTVAEATSQSVPASSLWGATAMGLCVWAAGTLAIRRRQTAPASVTTMMEGWR